jgi:predicted CXXCH cytochrome family protein
MRNVWVRRALALALLAAPVLLVGLPFGGRGQSIYLPGPTSDGHYQIESKCAECHQRFTGAQDESCRRCHGQALKDANDSHASGKFDDPGRAAQLSIVDARSCLPCHREHRPEARNRGTVTASTTFCIDCHAEVTRERPSHQSFAADGCASAGCHNYHDNQALYRDFLLKHRDEPNLLGDPRVPVKMPAVARPEAATPLPSDAPEAVTARASYGQIHTDWTASAHARGKVTCTGCHGGAPGGADGGWRDQVDDAACARCHAPERAGWQAGRHGMRVASGLTAMTPRLARLPMKHEATREATGNLGCTSCHGAHLFDRRWAAVEACEGCHDDAHTRAYRGTAHERAWQREQRAEAPPGSGVSCATCHMPRQRSGGEQIAVVHNQNANLRPNDKMIRSVCMSCHGVGYSLTALADGPLIERNFPEAPSPTIRTGMDLIKEGATTDAK